MDFETIIWLVFAIIWMVFSGFNSKKKKEAEQRKKGKLPQGQETQRKAEAPMEEVLRELRRKAESALRTVEETPKPVVVQTAQNVKRKASNKQELVKGKDVFSMEEKRKSIEYDSFVRQQRRTEHDAENRHLEERIQHYYIEDDNVGLPVLDLRDIVIADAILNKPYN